MRRGELLLELRLMCKIEPLRRPRWSGKWMYQPKQNQKNLYAALDGFLKENKDFERIDGPVVVDMFFMYEKHPRCQYPDMKKYGDLDNLNKAVNDALVSKGIIQDDRFILASDSSKQFDDRDYAIIYIYDVED